MPTVKTILAALLWLAARHRERPSPETRQALTCQARRLALHPEATRAEVAQGLSLAGLALPGHPAGQVSLH